MTRRWPLRLYRLFALLCCLAGLAIQFGLLQGRFHAYTLRYFTVLSNIACLAMWLALLLRPGLKAAWHGMVAESILLTMTVYHFMLAGGRFSMGGAASLSAWSNLLLHYAVPMLMLADFLLLAPRQPLSRLAPLQWTAFPLAYLAFAMAMGALGIPVQPTGGSAYPYDFLDPGRPGLAGFPQGLGGVALNCALLSAAFIAVGYLMRLIYLALGRRRIKPSAQAL